MMNRLSSGRRNLAVAQRKLNSLAGIDITRDGIDSLDLAQPHSGQWNAFVPEVYVSRVIL